MAEHYEEFRQLITPFPDSLIQKAPQGKFGDYVAHYDINQAALRIVGHHDFQVIEMIRGYAPPMGAVEDGKHKYPGRDNAIIGVVAELRANVDGMPVIIREIGTEDSPAMHHDAENAKRALSDAYKRCWMRAGLGLHLWCKRYWLDGQVEKDAADTKRTT